MGGWVYIFSNRTMPGLLKVGYTENDPISRAKEISDSTGVPVPYEVEYQIYATHPYQLEQAAHKNLDNFRVNKKREFFKCSYEDAVKAIRDAVNHLNSHKADFSFANEISHKMVRQELERKLAEKQKAREEEQRRRLQNEAEEQRRRLQNEARRLQNEAEARKIKEEFERKRLSEEKERRQKELEARRIEDRTRLVTKFNNKKKREEFQEKIVALGKYLSKREAYVYSRVFPLDDIELRDWVLDPEIDDSIIIEYLKIHYPSALDGISSYISSAQPSYQTSLYGSSNYISSNNDVPTEDDEKKLLDLERFVANKIRIEQEKFEQERLEQERLEQERLEQERLEQERLEQERLEQERLEQERLEQENFKKIEKEVFTKIQEIENLEKQAKQEKSVILYDYNSAKGLIFGIALSVCIFFVPVIPSVFTISGIIIFAFGAWLLSSIKRNKAIELVDERLKKERNLIIGSLKPLRKELERQKTLNPLNETLISELSKKLDDFFRKY